MTKDKLRAFRTDKNVERAIAELRRRWRQHSDSGVIRMALLAAAECGPAEAKHEQAQ